MQHHPPLPPPHQPFRPADQPASADAVPPSLALSYLRRIAYLEEKVIIGEATLKAANARLEGELDEVYASLRNANEELTDLRAENSHIPDDGIRAQQEIPPDGNPLAMLAETALHHSSAEQQSRQLQEIQRLTLLVNLGSRAAERWKARSDQLERDCAMLGVDHRAKVLQNKQLLAERDAALSSAAQAELWNAELQKEVKGLRRALQGKPGERPSERDVSDHTVTTLQDKLNDAEEQNRGLVQKNQEYASIITSLNTSLAQTLAARHTAQESLAAIQIEKASLTDTLHKITSDFKLLTVELYSANLNIHSGLREMEITNDQLTDALQTCQTEVQQLTEDKETLQKDALSRTEQVEWLRGRVEEMTVELKAAREQRADALDDVEMLHFEKDSLLARLQSTIARVQEAESELEDAREDLDAQRVEMWVLQQRWEAAMKELEALRAGNSDAPPAEQIAEASGEQVGTPSMEEQLSSGPPIENGTDKQGIVQSDSGITRVQADGQVSCSNMVRICVTDVSASTDAANTQTQLPQSQVLHPLNDRRIPRRCQRIRIPSRIQFRQSSRPRCDIAGPV